MLLSNEQVSEVWCPFGRTLHQPTGAGAAAVNRVGSLGTNCLGSACMAWRWAGWRLKGSTLMMVAPNPLEEDRDGPRVGYCGLAGKPFGAA